jgi:hypothetical protein
MLKKAEGKGQKAKVRNVSETVPSYFLEKTNGQRQLVRHFCLLPFAFCLDPSLNPPGSS